MSTQHPRTKSLLVGLMTVWVLCLAPASCVPVRPTTAEILASGFADLRGLADTVIADEDRRKAYRQLSGELESALLAFNDYAVSSGNTYQAAFIDYAVGPDELRERSNAFRERQRATQERFIELHLAMAEKVTAEEWRALSPQEARIIESLLNTATGKRR